MTVSSTNRKAGPYYGNGVTTAFPFSFKVFAASDLLVVKTNLTTGVDTVLAATDYSVSLTADTTGGYSGGTVTLTAGALASAYTLTITSSILYTQNTDLTNNGGYYPKVINSALDRLTILCQQLLEQVSRSLKLSISTPPGVTPTLPAPVKNNMIAWNANGDGLQNLDPQALATIVAFGTANSDKFSGDGTTTQFALSNNPGALNNLDVSIGGVTQRPGIDYTWSAGTVITFTTAPATGTNNILVRYMQGLPQGYTTGDLVQVNDGAGGTLFTNVSGFISRVMSSTGSAIVGFIQTGTGAISRFVQDKLRENRKSVEDFGGVADGTTNNDAAILKAATASNGRFHFPGPGIYVCSSSVWAYAFTAGDNVQLKISGTLYDVSNAVAGAWRLTVDSPVLMSLRHAVSGNVLQSWQDGSGGTATYFYRGLAFRTDSHWCQVKPASLNGSTDLLWQRSDLNADPNGNRFNETYSEAIDRLDFSFATTAAGSPNFDSYMQVNAGTSPKLAFPALLATFNQGFGTQARTGATFGVSFVPKTSSVISIKDSVGGSEIGTVDLTNGFTFAALGWANASYGYGQLTYITGGVAIAVSGAGSMAFYQNGGEAWRINTSKNFIPGSDNTYSLGEPAKRVSVVYAGTATINTSDERAKQDIDSIPQSWLDAWAEVGYCRFKYRDAVAEKGDSARWHVGVIAQRVKEAFEKHGIDPFQIGVLCWDKWDDQYVEELVTEIEIKPVLVKLSEPEFEETTIQNEDGTERPVKILIKDAVYEEQEIEVEKQVPKRKLAKKAGERYGIRYEEALVLESAYLRHQIQLLQK